MMEKKRIDLLLEYQAGLATLYAGGYKCDREIRKANLEIEKVLRLSGKETTSNESSRVLYYRKIKELTGDLYTENPINEDMYKASILKQEVKTITTDRGSGVTTSAFAIAETLDNTVLVVEYENIKKEFNSPNVLCLDDITRGSSFISDNDLFIFDEVSNRDKLIRPIQEIGSKKKIIKISQIERTE